MVDNNLDKYTIIVEEQDNYTIELNGQGPQGARGPIGPQGIQGERGEKGEQGDIGPANTLTVGSVTKGEEAEVTIEGESPNQTINFVLPKGDKGDKGDQGIQGIQGVQGIQGEVGPVGPQGKAATITIGKVDTGEPNTQASVTNVGTSTDSVLNFTIPRGYKGEAATIVVGSTTTSEPGTEANVVNSGDENMAILEFTIPKGEKGDKGDIGEQGQQGIQGLTGPQGPQGIQGDVGPKGDKGDQGIEGPRGPQGLRGISVTGVEQISKVGLVATYRMSFSDGTHFDYEVTDGSVEGVTREQVISLIGYEPASYTSVEGLTTRVEALEERVEDLTASKFPNVVIIGTPSIEGGQVSGYSNTNYLQFPFVDISRGLPFDIYFSFTTGNDVTTQQNLLDSYFGIALAIQNGKGLMALSSNGTSWNIGNITGTNTILPNTTYYAKCSWTGTQYNASLSTNNTTYIPDMILNSTLTTNKTTIFIGGSPDLFGAGTSHPFKGTINFNNSRVDVQGTTVWEGMADVGLASRANVSLNNLDEVGESRFINLQEAIDTKQPIGDYATNTSLTTHTNNATIHVTASDKTAWNNKQPAGDYATKTELNTKQDKGDYALKSEIPTKTSQLTNDSGFINNDSTFVHKSGDETISGVKTFSSTISGSINGKSTQLGTPRVGTDYNSLPIKNTTYIEEHQNSSPNQPEANWFFTQTMQGGDVNYAGQLAMGMTSENVYYRNKYANNWLPWKKLAFTTDNVTSATKATQDGNGNNIVNTYATKTSLNAKADTSLSNITDAGKQVIKDNSGGWNPPLLSSFWADHLLNRMDMLRADTFSWQDGTTYSSVYNELLSEYNNSASTTKTDGSITYKLTPKGYKIALPSQETAIAEKYATDGIAWYYILDNGDSSSEGGLPDMGDTTNKRFKLPRAKHPSLVNSTSTAPVVGNGMTLGFSDGTYTYGTTNAIYGASRSFNRTSTAYGKSVGINIPETTVGTEYISCGITTDPTKSGMIADLSNNVKDYNMYLYFYVGGFTESAEAQTAGLNSELLNGKADVDTPSIQAPYLKYTYVNGTSGYNIWSNGYCEQWGEVVPLGAVRTITFLKLFKDTNYSLSQSFNRDTDPSGATFSLAFYNKTSSSVNASGQFNSSNNVGFTGGNDEVFSWKASGYLASGQY